MAATTLIQPHLLGIGVTHTPDFVIDRPRDPYGSSLILSFRSAATILTARGRETAGIGDCIVHTPDFPQYHAAVPGSAEGYRNDWLHVSFERVRPLMERRGLPFDTLIPTGHPEILTPFLRNMMSELLTPDRYTDDIITNQLEGMLLSVAKRRHGMKQRHKRMTAAEQAYFPRFQDVRQKALLECSRRIGVRDLARTLNMSPERFTVLYRKFFRATPYAEILDARLLLARRLLVSTSLSLKSVARQCGWDDVQFFSRLFKAKVGLPPSEYRAHVLP